MTSSPVDLQKAAFQAIDELCSTLSDEEWDVPTECPGWSVKDNVSHLIGTESMLLGRQRPEHDPGEKPWIKNDPGRMNEVEVDYRRSWPPQKVLEEYREVVAERLKNLEGADLDGESWTPLGQGKVRDLLSIRSMDIWVHEQDIRRAIGRPGGLDGPVAENAVKRHTSALPFVVGKKVSPPEGTTVVFDVDGKQTAIAMQSPRAAVVEAPDAPTVKLSMDLETFNRLCTGRGDPDEVGKNARIEGDEALGRRIVSSMNFMI